MDEFEILDLDGLAASLAAEPLEPIEYIGRWAVLDRDPLTGKVTVACEEDGLMTVEEWMPVDGLLQENHAIRGEIAGTRHGDGLSLTARVPMNMWQKHLADPMAQGDTKHIDRWLAEHSAFRIRKA